MCHTILTASPYTVQSFYGGLSLTITRNDGPGRVRSVLLQGDDALFLETELSSCPEGREVDLVLSAYDDVMETEGVRQ